MWSSVEIFREFKKLKPTNYQTDSVYGPFVSRRHANTLKEHNRDCSFSPSINRTRSKGKLDFLQKRHISMIEEGLYDDINSLLLKELDEVKSIHLDDSQERPDPELYKGINS